MFPSWRREETRKALNQKDKNGVDNNEMSEEYLFFFLSKKYSNREKEMRGKKDGHDNNRERGREHRWEQTYTCSQLKTYLQNLYLKSIFEHTENTSNTHTTHFCNTDTHIPTYTHTNVHVYLRTHLHTSIPASTRRERPLSGGENLRDWPIRRRFTEGLR